MNDRPKIKLQLSSTDKVMEAIGWIIVFGTWILVLISYSTLSEIIPIHYNGSGQADGFGKKINILTLPIVSTVLFIGLTVLNNYSHLFNYTSEITKENSIHQYTNATRLIRYMKLAIAIIFAYLVFMTIQNAKGNADGLGVWFLPFTMGLLFVPIFYFLINSNKTPPKKL